jgi:23S rRNA (guanosine2251-2'-O)-methyltransferase
MSKTDTTKVLILHNIRSVLNVGAIFRTADAIGINQIFLTGYTPAPIDRFGRERSDLHKSALGAEKNIQWQSIEKIDEVLDDLREQGFKIIALEQSDNSVDYKKVSDEIYKEKNIAVILGNETDGIDSKIINSSDLIAEIPMKGNKESLNVSVATGVLLYRLFDR